MGTLNEENSVLKTTSKNSPDYWLGSEDEEVTRLGFQHTVWRKEAHSLWNRAKFGAGQRILDLGCGPGYTTLEIGELAGPEGSVLGIDSSEKFLNHLKTQMDRRGTGNIQTLACDVHEMELPSESFDRVYSRWLMCFLREPRTVVQKIARALKPGGILAINDYFSYDWVMVPRSKAFDHTIEAIRKSWQLGGANIEIQKEMPEIMLNCGLEIIEIQPIHRLGRPGGDFWNWAETFLENYLPKVVDKKLLTEDEFSGFWVEWSERKNNPDSFIMTPVLLDILGKKK